MNDHRNQKSNRPQLFIIRHGESEHNIGQFYSCSNRPGSVSYLTAKGREEIREKAQSIDKNFSIDPQKISTFFTSPLMRTIETSEILLNYWKIPFEKRIFDPLITEVDAGKFDGKKYSALKDPDGQVVKNWDNRFFADYEGENDSMLVRRIRHFVEVKILPKVNDDKHIFVISHGSPMKVLLETLTGLPLMLGTNEYAHLPVDELSDRYLIFSPESKRTEKQKKMIHLRLTTKTLPSHIALFPLRDTLTYL